MYARFSCQKFDCKDETTFTQVSEKEHLYFLSIFAADGILSLYILIICGEVFKEERIEDFESKELNTGRNKVSKRMEVRHQDRRWRSFPE